MIFNWSFLRSCSYKNDSLVDKIKNDLVASFNKKGINIRNVQIDLTCDRIVITGMVL